jgi:hypothetical protein
VGKEVWFIPYDFSVVLRRDLQFSSPQLWIFFFFFLSTSVFLLQQHWPVTYTPPPTMVLAIYGSSLTVLSSLRFKIDACSWVKGLLFGKEGEGLLHAAGRFWGRVRVTLSLSLLVFIPPLKQGGLFGTGLSVFLFLFWFL